MAYKGIWIETTTRCNLRCLSCGKSETGDDMPLELFQKIAGQCFPHIGEVNLTGIGEPVITKNFYEMCETVIKKHGKRLSFITNGMLLNKDEALLDLLIDDRVSFVLSIDGIGGTYEKLRRGAKWQSMLELLGKIKEKREEKRNSFSLGLNFVLSRENKEELLDVVRRAATEWAVDYMCVIMMQPWKGNDSFYDESSPVYFKEEANRLMEEAGETAKKHNLRMMLPAKFSLKAGGRAGTSLLKLPMKNSKDPAMRQFFKYPMFFYFDHYTLYRALYGLLRLPRLRCYVPFEWLYFKVNGEVTPCCGLQSHIVGSMKDSSIREILDGGPFEAIRRNMAYKYVPAECFRCNLPIGINGGNPDK